MSEDWRNYVEEAKRLPGAQGFSARFSASGAEHWARMLATEAGRKRVVQLQSQDGGNLGAIGKTIASIAPTVVKVALSATGVGAIAAKVMQATAKPFVPLAPLPEPEPVYEPAPLYNFQESYTMPANFDFSGLLKVGADALVNYQLQKKAVEKAQPPQRYMDQVVPTQRGVALPGGAVTPAIFPGLAGILGGAARIVPAVGGAVVAGGRYVMTAIGSITKARAVAIAKTLGIQAAAAALTVGVVELAQWILDEDEKKKRRRGAGVTAAQLRTTRKTMRKVMGMARTIRASCSETGFIARRRSSGKSCPAPRVIVTKR